MLSGLSLIMLLQTIPINNKEIYMYIQKSLMILYYTLHLIRCSLLKWSVPWIFLSTIHNSMHSVPTVERWALYNLFLLVVIVWTHSLVCGALFHWLARKKRKRQWFDETDGAYPWIRYPWKVVFVPCVKMVHKTILQISWLNLPKKWVIFPHFACCNNLKLNLAM